MIMRLKKSHKKWEMTMDFIIDLIRKSKNVAIMSHINMDGDALGSSLGLMLALKKIGKNVTTYIEEDIPIRFEFLKNTHGIEAYRDDTDFSLYDTLIVVDVADKNLLGNRVRALDEVPTVIAIDHHAVHYKFCDNSYVDKDAAAVGELIYELINKMGIQIDTTIATCLYIAILTDTGRFKFNSTTKRTHMIAGDLIEYGVDSTMLANRLFDESTKERTRLIASVIQTLETFCQDKIAVMYVTRSMIKEVLANESDQEGIIDFVINIRGVEVGILIKEKQDGILRASIRSKSYVDVSKIANEFGGGGHKMASGCSFSGDIMEFRKKLVDFARREIR